MLFNTVHKVTIYLQFLSPWMKCQSVTIQIKATEKYFPMALFIVLYKVILTFESVNENLKSYNSNESCWVLSAVVLFMYYIVMSV